MVGKKWPGRQPYDFCRCAVLQAVTLLFPNLAIPVAFLFLTDCELRTPWGSASGNRSLKKLPDCGAPKLVKHSVLLYTCMKKGLSVLV